MTVATLPGTAAVIARALGDRARLCDLYDEIGAPIYHDITCGDDSEVREVLAALRLVAPGGPVLELAAGAGRMMLPVIASGRSVTALDTSPTLLGILADRLDELVPAARARARLVVGDMANFSLDERYAVIALGSTSITLLSEPQRPGLYECVRRHLRPDGVFLVTVPLPVDEVAEVADIRRVAVGLSGRRYDMFDHVEPGTDYRTVTVIPVSSEQPSVAPVPVAVSRPRLFDGRVVGRELTERGFELVREVSLGGLTERLDALLQVWRVAR